MQCQCGVLFESADIRFCENCKTPRPPPPVRLAPRPPPVHTKTVSEDGSLLTSFSSCPSFLKPMISALEISDSSFSSSSSSLSVDTKAGGLLPKLSPVVLKSLREEQHAILQQQEKQKFQHEVMPESEALLKQFEMYLDDKKFSHYVYEHVLEKFPDKQKWAVLMNEYTNNHKSNKDASSLMEGFLVLASSSSSSAQCMYFTLRPGLLRFFKEKNDPKSIGEVILSNEATVYLNSSVSRTNQYPQFSYPFVIDMDLNKKKTNSKLLLYAETTETRDAWVLLLDLAILADPKKNKPLSSDNICYEMSLDMMTGIRTVVGRAAAAPWIIPTEKDFTERYSLMFPAKGSKETPPHKMRDFRFKDYCPAIFRRIRARFGIDPSSYLLDVCGNFNYLTFLSNSKSGEFFFFSHDRKYMIKTVSKGECKGLFMNIAHYYRHIMSGSDSLMTKFFGLHKVKPADQGCKWFLIMGSVFPTHLPIDRLFDIKGSTHNRSVKATERDKDGTVYKDNDFIEQGMKIVVGAAVKQKLEQQLRKDVELLESLRIIDYSILIGVHYKNGYLARATSVKVFLSEKFFSDSSGQTIVVDFKNEDTVEQVVEKTVKMMQALPTINYQLDHQDFVLCRVNGMQVFEDMLILSQQAPLSLLELVLKESLTPDNTSTTRDASVSSSSSSNGTMSRRGTGEDGDTPYTPSRHRSPGRRREKSPEGRDFQKAAVSKVIEQWKTSLSQLIPPLGAQIQPMSDEALLGLTEATFAAKAMNNSLAGCLLAELHRRVACEEKTPLMRVQTMSQIDVCHSMFTQTEGGISGYDSTGAEVIFYVGLIDTLIEYTLKKKMEHQYKQRVKGLEKANVSVVEPSFYAQRILNFISEHIE